jgi:hypothetical protein
MPRATASSSAMMDGLISLRCRRTRAGPKGSLRRRRRSAQAFFFGGLEAPYGVFELDLVGGLRGRPVEMVRGKVTGLPFPANAEIVLANTIADRQHHQARMKFSLFDHHVGAK